MTLRVIEGGANKPCDECADYHKDKNDFWGAACRCKCHHAWAATDPGHVAEGVS